MNLSVTGLIDSTTNKYLFIGSDEEKYFIHADTFTYADSSGIALCDYYQIDPNIDDCGNGDFDDDDNDDNDENIEAKKNHLQSNSGPTIIIGSMTNTLEYLIKSMQPRD
jgi:hypothetical protein